MVVFWRFMVVFGRLWYSMWQIMQQSNADYGIVFVNYALGTGYDMACGSTLLCFILLQVMTKFVDCNTTFEYVAVWVSLYHSLWQIIVDSLKDYDILCGRLWYIAWEIMIYCVGDYITIYCVEDYDILCGKLWYIVWQIVIHCVADYDILCADYGILYADYDILLWSDWLG